MSRICFLLLIIKLCLVGLFGSPIFAELDIAHYSTNNLIDWSNGPVFVVKDNDPMFPDREATINKLTRAFQDMLTMAAVACRTFNAEEEVYLRYFGESSQHPDLVQSIVCQVGSHPDGRASIQQILSDPPMSFRYKKLIITTGTAYMQNLGSHLPEQSDFTLAATTFQDLPQYGIGNDDETALIHFWPRAFDYPNLYDIFKSRGIKGLGMKDSGLMTTLGAHLLHEMMHWRYLVRNGNNQAVFDAVIRHTAIVKDKDGKQKEEERDYIDDYKRDDYEDKDIDPVDGYGPVNAASLVINEQLDSYRNADNYRWYIVSKFWQVIANHDFQEQDDESKGDKMIPEGAKGQVPYPGEHVPSRRRRGYNKI